MSKEEFNKIWKDSTKEQILNQYYYDYEEMIKSHNIIKEAINYIKEESWFCYKDDEEVIDRTPVNKLLEILGGNDE